MSQSSNQAQNQATASQAATDIEPTMTATASTASVPWALWMTVGFAPHEAQLQDLGVIHAAISRKPGAPRFISITTGRQYGKTKEAVVTALEGAFAAPDDFGAPVVKILADTYEHANLVWDKVEQAIFSTDLRRFVDTDKPGKGYDRERWIIYLKGGATIQKLSSDRPQSLTGYTASLIVIDEKAFVTDAAIEHLLPCVAVRQGTIVAFGTAEGTGWSRSWHFRGQDSDFPEYWSITHPSTDNPFLPLDEMESQRRSLPERRFRQLWEAQWVGDDGAVFHNIEGCIRYDWPLSLSPEPNHLYTIGLDLARYSDYTAIIVADWTTRRCVHKERYKDVDWTTQAARIAALVKNYNNARVWADTTHGSVGDVVIEILRKDYSLDIQGYNFTNASKSSLIDSLVWAMEREDIHFPEWKDLINELAIYSAVQLPSGATRLTAPAGFHDDLVTALALCNWGLRKGGNVVSKIPRQRGAWEGW